MKLHSVSQEQASQHACTRANLELVLAAWVESSLEETLVLLQRRLDKAKALLCLIKIFFILKRDS